tara:strand:+ start:267 stop:728 length:462 start_codon:yes stop_codon:yes gene_type:complete
MYVDITGGTDSRKFYVESMMRFCHDKLMPRMKSLVINVYIKSFGKDSSCGYCVPIDNGKSPRNFDIELNNSLKLRPFLETIAHEMVHVKQYARNELVENAGVGKHLWKGAWIGDEVDYYDLPWEIEAHGRETGLFIRYIQKHNLCAKSWTKSI